MKVIIEIGGYDIEFHVLGADLTNQCLLGLNVLDKVGGDVLVTNKVLQLPEEEILFVPPCLHAISQKDVRIEPVG